MNKFRGVFSIKAVIFDFDGTLANTLPICFYAFQQVFKEFDNRELSSDEIKSMFGPSETGIIRENLLHPNIEQAIELYYTNYKEKHTELVEFNQHMDDLLRFIKAKGMKLGIVTGKARRSLDISVQALNMEGWFDVSITGDDVTHPKPHQEGVLKALSILGIENNKAMFIGDSEADILAGKRADVYTIGVNWLPAFQANEFTTIPDSSYSSIADFMNFLKTDIAYES
ncbi:HAD family hydrolase [Virgibacillus flavescens]|uniref:HAD family hydrolase n=1 Tax=Virgibacillus flavescens TaxID=1611422 RepID=UPI003D352F87